MTNTQIWILIAVHTALLAVRTVLYARGRSFTLMGRRAVRTRENSLRAVLGTWAATGGFVLLFYGISGFSEASYAILFPVTFLVFFYLEWVYSTIPVLGWPAFLLTLAALPFVMYYLIEASWNPYWVGMDLHYVLLAAALAAMFLIVFFLVVPWSFGGLNFCIFFFAFAGMANSVVIRVRRYPIAPADVFSLKEAAAVAGGYEMPITDQMVSIFLLALLCSSLLKAARVGLLHCRRVHWKLYPVRLLAGLAAGAAAFACAVHFDIAEIFDIDWQDYQQLDSYIEVSFPVAFVLQIHRLFPERPEGYSKAQTDLWLEEAGNAEIAPPVSADAFSSFSNPNPVILTIMNESFADYALVGAFPDSAWILDDYYALQADPGTVESGTAYTSTFGGGTYRSEFEYLTGASMYNIRGAMPYTTFNFKNVPNLARQLREQGYTTIAMHPYDANNWKRNTVYPQMGFDAFYAEPEARGSLGSRFRKLTDSRGYLTDAGDYLWVLNVIREHEEPLFLFNVTMQNHGGYIYDDMKDIAVDLDETYDRYVDLKVYEGMIALSDDALGMLMEELRQLDRPVIVTFFGDHQPSLQTAFESRIFGSGLYTDTEENDLPAPESGPDDPGEDLQNTSAEEFFAGSENDLYESGQMTGGLSFVTEESWSNTLEYAQLQYITPYLIWTNYPTQEDDDAEAPAEDPALILCDDGVVSLNYLGALTALYAGAELTSEERFLLQMREVIPVINMAGVYTEGTGFAEPSESELSEEQLLFLQKYRCIQYQNLFRHGR